MTLEPLFESRRIVIQRLGEPPRQLATGRRLQLLVYLSPDTETSEAIRLLRQAAETLANGLPKVAR